MAAPRFVCIHGHFYQPPREQPWLEVVEKQDSAAPYHDWNERVTAECYAPNAFARILDEHGNIRQIVNNYSRISFNMGPTLLSWLESQQPSVYQSILSADAESQSRFGGHGSAIAQAYNHMILPLANRADKVTQIRWGIADFKKRFGRAPEGMWLAETAVDSETLDILAEHGIKFTILSPSQAAEVRPANGTWQDVSGARVDPKRPYLAKLDSGREISLFFYDGPISRGIAFEKLLTRGEDLANRLTGAFSDGDDAQIVHIATDGESYGHHFAHGDMGLAFALHLLEQNEAVGPRPDVQITNYGQFLEMHPPTWEARIFEASAWSCAHGVERWNSNCGCNTGGHGEWNQRWRGPLRASLNWLRDEVAPVFENLAKTLLKSPWEARNDYINVILDRSPESCAAFWDTHATHSLSEEEERRALMLLEIQRNAMLMYTSCGWFFDELSGIETIQIILYAGRVAQLAHTLTGDNRFEEGFEDRLEAAKSNLPEYGDGKRIYEMWVRPAMISLEKVGAHFAISSVFDTSADESRVGAYRVSREGFILRTAGSTRLGIGHARVTSIITQESGEFSYAVAHFGDHTITGGIAERLDDAAYGRITRMLTAAFDQADLAEVVRQIDATFSDHRFGLAQMFRNERDRVLDAILTPVVQHADTIYRRVYEVNGPLLRYLASNNLTMPESLRIAAERSVNASLRAAFQDDPFNSDATAALIDEAKHAAIPLNMQRLAFVIRERDRDLAEDLQANSGDSATVRKISDVATQARALSGDFDLWNTQNAFSRLLAERYPEQAIAANGGDEDAKRWLADFTALGMVLRVRIGD